MSRTRLGLYDGMILLFPRGLMSTAVSASVLGGNYGRYIENMLPSRRKAGAGQKRYGCIKRGTAIGDGSNITKEMEYRKSDGTLESLVYTDNGKIKRFNEGAGTYTDLKTGLNTAGTIRHVSFNEKLIIVNGQDTPMSYDGTSITDISEYVVDNATSPTWIAANQFSINTAARGDGDYPDGRSIIVNITASGLGVSGITRSGSTATATTTANHNLANGTSVTVSGADQSEYNITATISNVTANTFDYTVSGTPTTPATGTITYAFTGVERTTTVSSTSLTGTVLTVTTAADVMPAASVTVEDVQYEVSPPAFSDIYAEHNLLWALTAGELKANDYRGADGLKIFHTDATNNEARWYDTTTQEVNFINLTNKHGVFDELVKISSLAGNMVFHGRQKLQIWTGDDPNTTGGFVWVKTIPVGTVHGDLVQEFPGDVLFFTEYGARSLRTVFQTEGQEVVDDLGTNVDPTITDYVTALKASDTEYKKAKSFVYVRDGFYGFHTGDMTLIYSLGEEAKGWVYFSGFFKTATSFTGLSDGRLSIAVGDQLYVYANGVSGDAAYSDDGTAIRIAWWKPWETSKSQRWANRSWEVIMELSANITLTLRRFKGWDDFSNKEITFDLQPEGAFWDVGYWDDGYWDSAKKVYKARDKFVANSYGFLIENTSTEGAVEILGIRPIGR